MNNDQLEALGKILIGSFVASAEYRREERMDALIAGAAGLWVLWDGVSKYHQ